MEKSEPANKLASASPWEEGAFYGPDHLRLFYKFYPGQEATDCLVILHGHGEHSGRYEKFAAILKHEKVSIASMDLRGSGRSEGREVYVESLRDYIDDFSAFIQFLKLRYGIQNKIILLGHSLGGLIAVHWAIEHSQEIKGMILSSPCLGLRLPGFLTHFNGFLNHWFPKLLYQNPVYPPHLTHNPEEVILYRNDPFIKRKITVRLIHEMLKSMSLLERKENIRFPFPVYILTAGIEKVVDSTRTRTFFQRLEAPEKDLIVFDGYYHEIFNELGQDKVFDALKVYLNKVRHFTGSSSSGTAR
ncbi:MAG: lysophospholipase [Candidatus Omnitrophica bacterium]|nr:lysophospholipase [Candidatus Omnitrophota bacterium]